MATEPSGFAAWHWSLVTSQRNLLTAGRRGCRVKRVGEGLWPSPSSLRLRLLPVSSQHLGLQSTPVDSKWQVLVSVSGVARGPFSAEALWGIGGITPGFLQSKPSR